jgi:hypothetical protein
LVVSAVVTPSEKVVAARVSQGVRAFLVPLALVLPLTIGFARVFAAVSETPFVRKRSWSGSDRARHSTEGAPG